MAAKAGRLGTNAKVNDPIAILKMRFTLYTSLASFSALIVTW